jgi:hypothetical protein
MDRNSVRAGLHREYGFEACDPLGPGNELIHVKRAWGSSPLSHFFSQALVSTQALATSPDARAIFTAKVRAHRKRTRSAGQQVRTVDGLYKAMVLEQPATYAAADSAAKHFYDLDRSYQEMQTAAEKQHTLVRLPATVAGPGAGPRR